MGFTPSPGGPIRGLDPGRVQRDRQVWSSWRTGRAHLMARLARQQERSGAQVGDFGVLAPGLCSEQVSCIWKHAQTSLQQTSYSYRTSCRRSLLFGVLLNRSARISCSRFLLKKTTNSPCVASFQSDPAGPGFSLEAGCRSRALGSRAPPHGERSFGAFFFFFSLRWRGGGGIHEDLCGCVDFSGYPFFLAVA